VKRLKGTVNILKSAINANNKGNSENDHAPINENIRKIIDKTAEKTANLTAQATHS
jgi:hypothetical protein